jgi:hypothetical protein
MRPGAQNPIPQLTIQIERVPREWTEGRCGRQLRAWHSTIVVSRYQIKNVLNVTALLPRAVVNCRDGRRCCQGPDC